MINPGSKGDFGSRNPAFLTKNPSGTIPLIEEPETGFVLSEAHAIMCYLCSKHGWKDLYPEDLQIRAKVNSYLHFHHRGARDASLGMFAPKVRKDLNIPNVLQNISTAIATRTIKILDTSWLNRSLFLTGDSLTIADMAAYVDIGQLHKRFTNIFDFDPYPNVNRWLNAMASVNQHDVAHSSLTHLGDIDSQAPSIEKIKEANKAGYADILKAVSEL